VSFLSRIFGGEEKWQGFTPAQQAWIDRQNASHRAVFEAQVAMLDEDLRPPLPTADENLCDGELTPWALALDMEERIQMQILRDVRRLLTMQSPPNGDKQGNDGDADRNPRADSVGSAEPTVKLVFPEKLQPAPLGAVITPNPVTEFLKGHVAKTVRLYRIFRAWLHGWIAAADGQTVNGGGVKP
jgi:hypothetical protein